MRTEAATEAVKREMGESFVRVCGVSDGRELGSVLNCAPPLSVRLLACARSSTPGCRQQDVVLSGALRDRGKDLTSCKSAWPQEGKKKKAHGYVGWRR